MTSPLSLSRSIPFLLLAMTALAHAADDPDAGSGSVSPPATADFNAPATACDRLTGIAREDCLRTSPPADANATPGTTDALPETGSASDFGGSAPEGIESFSDRPTPVAPPPGRSPATGAPSNTGAGPYILPGATRTGGSGISGSDAAAAPDVPADVPTGEARTVAPTR